MLICELANRLGTTMNRNDLRRVDMNLLVIFEALMFEKNLTRVAEKLFMGQPAVSAALGRLRDLFDDPLLLRNGRGMEPTPRALAILKELQPAMDTISGAVSRAKDFDPSTSCAVFRIGLSDDAEFGLFPPLLSQLREEAPGIIVVVRRANYLLMSALLASGEISVGVSYTTELPANAKRKLLRRVEPRILRADNADAPLTLDEFCTRPHVQVSYTANIHGIVDECLAKIGRDRKVVLSIPQFSSLPAALNATNLLASCPDYAAKALLGWGNLRDEPCPFEVPAQELSMVWLSLTDNDPAERWLRTRLEQHMGNLAATAA